MSHTIKRIITSFVLLSLILHVASCKTNETQKFNQLPAEYIITHQQPVTEQQLRTLFNSVEPFSMNFASPKMTLVKFTHDPGLQTLKKLINSSDIIDSIQLNYRYQKLR